MTSAEWPHGRAHGVPRTKNRGNEIKYFENRDAFRPDLTQIRVVKMAFATPHRHGRKIVDKGSRS